LNDSKAILVNFFHLNLEDKDYYECQ